VWSTDDLAESYAPVGETATPAELMYMLWSTLAQFSITTTVITSQDLAGDAQMTFTLDDETTPTSRVRAS